MAYEMQEVHQCHSSGKAETWRVGKRSLAPYENMEQELGEEALASLAVKADLDLVRCLQVVQRAPVSQLL